MGVELRLGMTRMQRVRRPDDAKHSVVVASGRGCLNRSLKGVRNPEGQIYLGTVWLFRHVRA